MGHWPCPRERGWSKESSTVKTQLQSRTASGLPSWFQYMRTAYKLKLPHPTEGGADQAAASEREKKTNKQTNTIQPPGKTTESFCLNTRTGCYRSKTRTSTETEILLLLTWIFCLFLLFPVCLCLFISSHWFLCCFFFFLLLLVLLLWISKY
jgi:hypothetical protein